MTSGQPDQASPLNSENKAPNVDHIKNQLINFGSHEKATHNDIRDELKQQKSTNQQHQQQQPPIQQQSQLQQSNASEMRVSPKANCFNLSGASAQSETALATADDNTISVGNNHQQQITGNCPPTTPAISTATSPLIENGTTAAAAAAYMQEKYLPSSTTSPSDLRKEFDAKVNGKYFMN